MRAPRGYSMIELLVAAGISVIGIGAALAVLSAQNASFSRQFGVGSAIAQSEFALDYLERAVRLAGTGIDPQMAFDFDFYRCVLPGGTLQFSESAGCAAGARDSASQPDTLVVAYRDPSYSTAAPTDTRPGCGAGNAATFVGKVWGVTAATNGSVTLVLKPGDTLSRGQVLQLVCNDGLTYTYATVASPKVAVPANNPACVATTVSLYNTALDPYDPYNQPSFLANGCFSNGGATAARAYAVRRQRYFVARDTTNPANPHGYLVLDQGLDLNDDGKLSDLDLLPIAADVLDLQLAYATEQPGIMALPTPPTGWAPTTYVTDSNANGIWGDDPGAAEELAEPVHAGAANTPTTQFQAANAAFFSGVNQSCTSFAGLAFYQYPCLFGTSPVETSKNSNIHAYRWTAWTGNIAEVLIGLVAQSPVAEEPTKVSADERDLPALFNRSALAAPAYNPWYQALSPFGRKRIAVRTGVRPANMALSSPYWN